MKKLQKVTESYATAEAIDIIKNLKEGDDIYTSEEIYTIVEITNKTFRCRTPMMRSWESKRKVLNKIKVESWLEEGLCDLH
jgi:hypothetical protein